MDIITTLLTCALLFLLDPLETWLDGPLPCPRRLSTNDLRLAALNAILREQEFLWRTWLFKVSK